MAKLSKRELLLPYSLVQRESRGLFVKTQVFNAQGSGKDSAGIREAACLLTAGGLVAFPTETVYGLGANALDGNAVEKIFHAKGRPSDNPLIVHIADPAQMEELAQAIPPEAYILIKHFWPGPLTLVLAKRDVVPDAVTGGLDSVAIRIPDHPVALDLLRMACIPVAAPSANLSGRPSPTTAQHVLDDLAGRIDAVVDGGPCGVGVESTVLDIRGGDPLLLRPGGVTPGQISTVLGRTCRIAAWQEHSGEAPPSPGLKYTHYAPRAPLYLVLGSAAQVADKIRTLRDTFQTENKRVGLLLSQELASKFTSEAVEILGPGTDPAQLAANLYLALRRLDESDADVLIAQGYSEEGMGLALMNRLKKAAGPRVIKTE